jgi:hypothetical protein
MQLSFGGHEQFVAYGYVAPQVGVVDVADANIVPVLLDWGIVLQAFNFVFGVSAKPIVNSDSSGHSHFVRGAGSYLNVSGAGAHVEIHGSSNSQSSLEGTLGVGGCRDSGGY